MEKLPILNYSFKADVVRIIPISCLHIGNKNYNQKKAKAFLNYILKTKDTYAIMLGDTIENVLAETAVRHPGSMHDQNMSVEEQRDEAVNLLQPLADAEKILAWTESNHSLRSWYAAGFSPEKWIADALGVPFCGTDALIHITVSRQVYVLHATHGVGSSTSLPSVFGKLLAQAARVTGADVYIRGHHHKKLLGELMPITKDGQIRKVLYAATGCFMSYIGGYGHRKELTPVVPGCVKIKLYGKEWDIHATL